MNFTEFLLTIPVLVNLYAEQYHQDDKTQTMVDLANEFNVPQINVYDFIIGKLWAWELIELCLTVNGFWFKLVEEQEDVFWLEGYPTNIDLVMYFY